jgi:DNA-binding transcriptional MerR regulator
MVCSSNAYADVNVRNVDRLRSVNANQASASGGVVSTWSITELAEEYGVTLRTLRHYESLGLLSPERRGTTRVFHNRDRIRLELVLRGRRLGFSLDEIGRIVNMYDDRPGEAGQLQYLLDQIEVRRAELARMRADIEQTERDLDAVERRCRETLATLAGGPGR